VTVSLVN